MTESLQLSATERTPLVDWDPQTGRLHLEGEAYPEDAAAFFGPILESVSAAVESATSSKFHVSLAMIYFNSSSAKALMNLFQMLEHAASRGCDVLIEWIYREDDLTMQEFGEDFSEDFEHARFECVVRAAS